MHKLLFKILVAALLAGAVACNKTGPQPQESGDGVFVMKVEAAVVDSKVNFGELSEGTSGKYYPVSWNEMETANISEFYGKARSQDKSSVKFQRGEDKSRGVFSFSLDAKNPGSVFDYVVIIPQSAVRTTGTAAAKKNRASFALAPTVPQKPSADGPDPAACIMMAQDLGYQSQPSTLSLHFTHQLAYAKMTVTGFPELEPGEKLTQIKIQAPQGRHLSGRYWYNYSTGEYAEYEGSMEDYILVDTQNLDPSDLTLWFSTFPVNIRQGETLSLTATTSGGRSLSAKVVLGKNLNLDKGRVSDFTVDWTKCQDKTLTFDFTTWPAGWPEKLVNGTEYKYGDYVFTHYGYSSGAPSTNRCTHKGTSPDFMVLNGLGFLSLPAMENHKLVKVAVTHAASKSNTRMGGVVYGMRTSPDSVEFVTAGAKLTSTWNVAPGTEVELPLLTSLPGHQYYLCCSAAGLGISKLALTYEYDAGADMSHVSEAIKIGTLNIWQPSARTSRKDAGEAPAEREWEYARYNIRDIIKDSGVELLAVQEATLRVRNDIKTDLKSTGRYAYEYFLHKPADPDHSSSVGLIYDKNRVSLNDTHHFWLSDTPDVSESQYEAEGSVRSAGTAVVTDLKTGRRYFVMVAHASLDDSCNDKDGELLVSRVKLYNTSNLPVIVMGDMNANWNMSLYRSLSSIGDDSRLNVELSQEEYFNPGTFNGSAGSSGNLRSRAQRIDFIFTDGVSVYSYKVNRTKYKAGNTMQFPSDHCPPMIECY